LIGTSTRIPDNFTLSATFDFSDASLLAATAIDIPGNNLFAQVTLAPCQGVVEYADRLFCWGEWNKVQNFVGMSMSAQFSPSTPAGWTAYGTGTQSAAQANQYSYTITGDGSQNAIGVIAQSAYQDSLNVPILKPLTTYRWRAFVRVSAVVTTASELIIDITGANNAVYSSSYDLTKATTSGVWVTATFPTMPATIDPSAIIRVYEFYLPAGFSVSISELQIIPDDMPVVGTQIRASYAFNPTAFDGVTGLLRIPGNSPVRNMWKFRDQLFIATDKATYYTVDSGSEPSSWQINEVSNKVGCISPRAADGSDEGYFVANRSGVHLLTGTDYDIISNEIKNTWDQINWAAAKLIWLRHDPVERMIYIGIPFGPGATSINQVLTCSFRSCQSADLPTPIHVTVAGKISATENSRKWSPWQLPALCGQILTTTTDDQMSFGLSTQSQIYVLNKNYLSDDDSTVPIPAYYVTAFMVGSDDELQFNLGSHRHLLQYVSASARGVGSMLITPYVDSTDNPRRPLRQKDLASLVMHDVEFPANVLGERTALRIEAVPATGSIDAYFQLRKLTMSLSADQLTPVGGRV
jgi:hypothetical protein